MINNSYSLFYTCPMWLINKSKQKIKFFAYLSSEVDVVKFIHKTATTALKIGENIPIVVETLPLPLFKNILTPIKIGVNLLMGFKTIDATISGKVKSWNALALNVAGYGLLFFTTLDLLKFCKVDISPLTKITKAVPFFGVLPYAGLLNVSLLTLMSSLLIFAVQKRRYMRPKWDKIDTKLKEWRQPLDQLHIAAKVAHYDSKIQSTSDEHKRSLLKTKQDFWKEREINYFEMQPSLEQIRQLKLFKWDKRALERKENGFSILGKSYKIGALTLTSVLILSGVASPIIGLVGIALVFPDFYLTSQSFFLKRKIKKMGKCDFKVV